MSIFVLRRLWISLIRDAAGRDGWECNLKFRSFQTIYIAVWKVSLRIKLALLSLVGVLVQSRASMNSVGGERLKAEKKNDQTSLLYPQSKKRCYLFSSAALHRRHKGETVEPHCLILSLVERRLKVTSQEMNACFGIFPLNHTELCHGTGGRWSYKWLHMREEEKTGPGALSPTRHRYLSSTSEVKISLWSGRQFLTKPIIGFLDLEETSHQLSLTRASRTTALDGSPVNRGPLPPVIWNKEPKKV